MSAQGANFAGGAGKKAVHVKWAGKTIALGTFPAAEADEKCARAKALTRAWRSTMRPKPSREWVMLELERLQVRVVSGRLGRKGGEEGEEDEGGKLDPKKAGMPNITDPTLLRRDSLLAGTNSLMGTRRDSITGLLSAAEMGGGRNNSLGWPGGDGGLGDLMHRRNSSLGMSLLPDDVKRRNSSLNLSSALDGDGGIPPHRPLVGGGSAAAYEAARADYYNNAQKDQARRASGLGSLGAGAGGNMNLSVNPNQHYEMLKLHHMNLLNEIQETTLMMNLYQQQQLQQNQMGAGVGGVGGAGAAGAGDAVTSAGPNNDVAMLLQQQGMGGAPGGGRLSLGLGGNNGGGTPDVQALLRQQQLGGGGAGSAVPTTNGADKAPAAPAATDDEAALQQRLQQLKDDIARRTKEAEDLEAAAKKSGDAEKRKADDEEDESDAKRTKVDGNDED